MNKKTGRINFDFMILGLFKVNFYLYYNYIYMFNFYYFLLFINVNRKISRLRKKEFLYFILIFNILYNF
ncbi:MAG: hypothetical protein EB092_05490 [Chitinophagia bacterium]|nr:hypothetical protein [Chitinophagia bacterium]